MPYILQQLCFIRRKPFRFRGDVGNAAMDRAQFALEAMQPHDTVFVADPWLSRTPSPWQLQNPGNVPHPDLIQNNSCHLYAGATKMVE
jgi:hypothetical protein